MKIIGAILLVMTTGFCFGQNYPLFKITVNNKVGYINASGEIVIKPIYNAGGDFSNGLAPVRKNGYYGYINARGKMVIKAKYDLATKFVNGIAAGFIGDSPTFINTRGERCLPAGIKDFYFIDKTHLAVTTKTDKMGVVNPYTGKFYIDTIYNSFGTFYKGVATVYKYRAPDEQKEGPTLVGVIDINGKIIVPFGRYERINKFIDGCALVKLTKDSTKESIDGAIDLKGRLLFKRPQKNGSYLYKDFHNGVAIVDLYKYWIPEKKGTSWTSDKAYEGYIDLKGKVVFNDTNYRYVNNFSNNRAFIKNEKGRYFIIDRKFKKVGSRTFASVLEHSFKNGYAVVSSPDGWGVIDTNANFLVKPQFDHISEVGVAGNYIFFYNDSDDDKRLYGIADLQGHVVLKPVIQNFDGAGFVNGLINCMIDGRQAYVNKKGIVVWRDDSKIDTLTHPKLNIDFMNRGYFYAYSKADTVAHDDEPGWAANANISKKIDHPEFEKDRLILRIDTSSKKPYLEQFPGYRLFIANTTGNTIKFNAQDGRLYVKLQARDVKGEWRDIEYTPNSWCGNSYHQLKLEPDNYWSFTIPQYDGEIKTQIRAQLIYEDEADRKNDKTVYSNEISGSVNPGQFWNKRQYISSGLMDPYNE